MAPIPGCTQAPHVLVVGVMLSLSERLPLLSFSRRLLVSVVALLLVPGHDEESEGKGASMSRSIVSLFVCDDSNGLDPSVTVRTVLRASRPCVKRRVI